VSAQLLEGTCSILTVSARVTGANAATKASVSRGFFASKRRVSPNPVSSQFINAATQPDEPQAESSSAESLPEPIRASNSFELESGHIVTLLDISLSKNKSEELQEYFNTQ
jgi:hypothetical protein